MAPTTTECAAATGPTVLADRARRSRSSSIRDLLAATRRPDVVSFAGGLPPTGLLPAEVLDDALAPIDRRAALQYGPTEGEPALRDWVAQHELGGVDPDDVVITTGAQQALALLVDALVDPGDPVALERASYVGMLQPLRAGGARPVVLDGDADGVHPLGLAAACGSHDEGRRPRLCYLAPTFQNPTGSVLSTVRRRQIGRLAALHGIVVIDDDPYRRLGFAHAGPPPRLREFVPAELAVTVGSFSKVVAPGLRVGWLHGPPWLIRRVVQLKQSADLHSSSLSQQIVMALVGEPGWLDGHVSSLVDHLRSGAAVLEASLERHLGGRVDRHPVVGGMFAWVDVHHDTDELLRVAAAHGVVFVPGSAFDPSGRPTSTARLCVSHDRLDRIDEGVQRLARALGRGVARARRGSIPRVSDLEDPGAGSS